MESKPIINNLENRVSIMAERSYYKVTDTNSDTYKNCSEFLQKEADLRKAQLEAIEARVPKFKTYRGRKGFYRIVTFIGFVFEEPEKLDPKEWKTELVEGYQLSTPNPRTKKGKEMKNFLRNFDRTNNWDLDRILKLDKQIVNGSFYPADLFNHNDTIYIFIDAKFRKGFEQENDGIIEITLGEMEKAIEEYNLDKN